MRNTSPAPLIRPSQLMKQVKKKLTLSGRNLNNYFFQEPKYERPEPPKYKPAEYKPAYQPAKPAYDVS